MKQNKHSIYYKKLSELSKYANNARIHDKKNVEQIADSIREFGFTNPILIDKNNIIIAGHGRIMAAEKLKMNTVPCIILDGLTKNQVKAYVIADNKLALNAMWDENILYEELRFLEKEEVDLTILGFSDIELKKFLDSENPEEIKISFEEEFGIYVRLNSEKEQSEFFEEITKRGLKCKIMN